MGDVSERDEQRYNDFFYPFLKSLEIVGDDGNALSNNTIQRGKAMAFVGKSMESLQKHFKRWMSPKLLPAALMADKAFALVVARLITGAPAAEPIMLQDGEGVEYELVHNVMGVHGCCYKVSSVESWLRNQWELEYGTLDASCFSTDAKSAAYLLLTGTVDFRSVDSFKTNPVVKKLWRRYLPLASQTQFVERGVKEAQTVAKTGRMEEQRSSYSIIRSFNVLCTEINDKTKVADRIDYLLANGDLHLERKDALIDEIGEDEYNDAVEEVKHLISYKGHFKRERVQGQIDAVTETAEQNKTTNTRQKNTDVDLTMVALELTEYRKLKKDDHTKDLIVELKHRGKGDSDLVYPPDHEKKAS